MVVLGQTDESHKKENWLVQDLEDDGINFGTFNVRNSCYALLVTEAFGILGIGPYQNDVSDMANLTNTMSALMSSGASIQQLLNLIEGSATANGVGSGGTATSFGSATAGQLKDNPNIDKLIQAAQAYGNAFVQDTGVNVSANNFTFTFRESDGGTLTVTAGGSTQADQAFSTMLSSFLGQLNQFIPSVPSDWSMNSPLSGIQIYALQQLQTKLDALPGFLAVNGQFKDPTDTLLLSTEYGSFTSDPVLTGAQAVFNDLNGMFGYGLQNPSNPPPTNPIYGPIGASLATNLQYLFLYQPILYNGTWYFYGLPSGATVPPGLPNPPGTSTTIGVGAYDSLTNTAIKLSGGTLIGGSILDVAAYQYYESQQGGGSPTGSPVATAVGDTSQLQTNAQTASQTGSAEVQQWISIITSLVNSAQTTLQGFNQAGQSIVGNQKTT